MKKIGLLLPLFGLFFLAGCVQQEAPTTNVDTGVELTGIVVEPLIKETVDTEGKLLAVVAQHSGADSCFTIISGAVYDLTSRIGKHPGGDKAILASCGKDATTMFDTKHGMDPKKWEGLKAFEIAF